jgi:hypothetical protein
MDCTSMIIMSDMLNATSKVAAYMVIAGLLPVHYGAMILGCHLRRRWAPSPVPDAAMRPVILGWLGWLAMAVVATVYLSVI